MKKYKVIKEYDRFYLAEDSKGFKECFSKVENVVDSDGYITIQESNYQGNYGLPPEKVNKKFNGGKY